MRSLRHQLPCGSNCLFYLFSLAPFPFLFKCIIWSFILHLVFTYKGKGPFSCIDNMFIGNMTATAQKNISVWFLQLPSGILLRSSHKVGELGPQVRAVWPKKSVPILLCNTANQMLHGSRMKWVLLPKNCGVDFTLNSKLYQRLLS